MQIVPSPVPQHQKSQIRKPSVCSAEVVDFVVNPPTKFTKRGTEVEEWISSLFIRDIANILFFSDFGVREGDSGAEPDAVGSLIF